jgi:hypothetical protein
LEQVGEKGGEEPKNVRNSVWQLGTGNKKSRWRARAYPNGKAELFYHSDLSSFGTVQSTLGAGGCSLEIFAPATCQLQFAKASSATLSQQEKNNTADTQRERVHLTGLIGAVVS